MKQTSLLRDRVSVKDPRADLKENRHGDSISTFPAKNYGLPAPRIREKPIQATEMQGVFRWDVKACSLQVGQISLLFKGETGWLQTASTATLSTIERFYGFQGQVAFAQRRSRVAGMPLAGSKVICVLMPITASGSRVNR